MEPDIKVMVVTHKECNIPKDPMYIPVLVGPNKEQITMQNFYLDNQGENISNKNKNYCELTAMYWAWKNLKADYIGLVHYRRFFMSVDKKKNILKHEELEVYLNNYDVILPKKRNYFIENTWSHYQHNHNIEDMRQVEYILKEKFPDYLDSFNDVMTKKKSHRFNMFVMKKDMFDEYSKWLFNILFDLEKRIDILDYDPYQARVFGFISERLLDVWITKNQIDFKELPYKFMEKQNWFKKGYRFLKNKFLKKSLF